MYDLSIIGGKVANGYSITLFMLKGYDKLSSQRIEATLKNVESMIEKFRDKEDSLRVVEGNLNNPYFRWPVLAQVVFKDEQNERR